MLGGISQAIKKLLRLTQDTLSSNRVRGLIDKTIKRVYIIYIDVFNPFFSLLVKTLVLSDSLVRERRQAKIREIYPKLSVVKIIQKRREDKIYQARYLLLIATLFCILSNIFFDLGISNFFPVIFIATFILLNLESFLFDYRIRKGWYGTNETEAREIVKFILDNSDNIDFTDGGSTKSVINPEDIREIAIDLGIQLPGYPEPDFIRKA